MPIWIYLAAALAIFSAGATSGWKVNGWRHDSAKLEQQQKVAAELKAVARGTFRIQENRDAEIVRTGDQLADALGRLRKRPAVRLVETPAACAGASPAALSAEDGAVALRLAGEADRLRADYAACREWVDQVSEKP